MITSEGPSTKERTTTPINSALPTTSLHTPNFNWVCIFIASPSCSRQLLRQHCLKVSESGATITWPRGGRCGKCHIESTTEPIPPAPCYRFAIGYVGANIAEIFPISGITNQNVDCFNIGASRIVGDQKLLDRQMKSVYSVVTFRYSYKNKK